MLGGKSMKPIQESSDLRVVKNIEWFLDYAFVPLSGPAGRSEFALDYSLQWAIVICLYAFIENHVFAVCDLSTMCGFPAMCSLPL